MDDGVDKVAVAVYDHLVDKGVEKGADDGGVLGAEAFGKDEGVGLDFFDGEGIGGLWRFGLDRLQLA